MLDDELRDRIIRIDERTVRIEERINSHASRIRGVEIWQEKVGGGVTLAGYIMSGVIAIAGICVALVKRK